MKPKYLLGGLALVLALWFLYPSRTPGYNPERDYVESEAAIMEALILAKDSAVIELPAGHFLFSQPLSIAGKKQVTLRGQGMDKTVLSFKGQAKGAQGLLVSDCDNFTIEHLTIEDAAGDNLKITDSDGVRVNAVRAAWTGKVSTENGAYGIYPVLCTDVVIENSEAIGASDAGIYVGQSQNVIIRNNKAYYNVAGIESENSSNVEIYGNEAYENTGGLLIFNLPELTHYGKNVVAYGNHIHDNNLKNFGVEGSIVSQVPKGTGVIIMATQQVAFFENTVANHKTVQVTVVSYDLFASGEEAAETALSAEAEEQGLRAVTSTYREDADYNPYPEGIGVYKNTFANRYRFPTLSNDFGLLWWVKNGSQIPDMAFDGIFEAGKTLATLNYQICFQDNGPATFVYLDAANDFELFSNDLTPFDCELEEPWRP